MSTFTWEQGRRLASAENIYTRLSNSYTYDADGLRLSKTVGSVEHKYVWQGSRLVSEYFGGKELEFFYDESGSPYAFSYKTSANAIPSYYYYVTNLQGDVVSILDANGTEKASYSYNAWGKILSATGDMASVNPLRYRGYYYDDDTGFYALQSRYYDPQICRFINADDTDTLFCSPNGLTDKNLFAYCDNNPIMRVDLGGDFWLPGILIGGAIGGVISGAVSAISQYATTGKVDIRVMLVNAASGAISGALSSTAICLGTSVVANAVLGGVNYVAEQAVKGERATVGGVIASTLSGAVGAVIGGKGADAKSLSTAFKRATKEIFREQRRANIKYATKQIAKYTAEKIGIKNTVSVSIGRFTAGTIGSTYTRFKLGY